MLSALRCPMVAAAVLPPAAAPAAPRCAALHFRTGLTLLLRHDCTAHTYAYATGRMTEARSLGAARSSWALLAALVLAAVATVALLSSEGAAGEAVRFGVPSLRAAAASPLGRRALPAPPARSAAIQSRGQPGMRRFTTWRRCRAGAQRCSPAARPPGARTAGTALSAPRPALAPPQSCLAPAAAPLPDPPAPRPPAAPPGAALGARADAGGAGAGSQLLRLRSAPAPPGLQAAGGPPHQGLLPGRLRHGRRRRGAARGAGLRAPAVQGHQLQLPAQVRVPVWPRLLPARVVPAGCGPHTGVRTGVGHKREQAKSKQRDPVCGGPAGTTSWRTAPSPPPPPSCLRPACSTTCRR